MSELKFDINPHVIRQLGAELVTDPTTALLELIKNSYDADATYVDIVIDTEGTYKDKSDLFYPGHSGYISVEDDGFGMSRDTIINSWLVISASKKRGIDGIKPKTPKGRTPLGDKGLGRLSTQRLAETCEIYTKKEGGDPIHVGFNWKDFDEVERLSQVEVDFKSFNDINYAHGTKLLLLNVLEKNYWKGKNLEKIKALLCQMIAPYDEIKPFEIYLTVNGESIDLDQEINKLGSLDISRSTFSFSNETMILDIDIRMRKLIGNDYDSYNELIQRDGGKDFLNYFLQDHRGEGFTKGKNGYWLHTTQEFDLVTALNTSRARFQTNVIVDPGDFKGQILEFSFNNNKNDNDWWNSFYKTFEEYRNFVQPQRGIKVYRNGFAVRPYGIDDNDWLKLGQSQTTGASYYSLRPGNVIGYVAIDGGKNPGLKDKTDREGFIENDSFQAFYYLLSHAIDIINAKMEGVRRCYNDYKKNLINRSKVKTPVQAFNEISKQATNGLQISRDYTVAQNNLKNLQKEVKAVVSRKTKFSDNEANTELKNTLNKVLNILSSSQAVLDKANELLKNSESLNDSINVLKPKLEALEEQLGEFTELASLGLISEMVSHDLGDICNRMLGKVKIVKADIENRSNVSEEIESLLSFIESVVSSLKDQIKHLDTSMKYNRIKKESFPINEMLSKEEIPFYEHKINKDNIYINLILKENFRVYANKGKLTQVFDNLINNSIYWLKANCNIFPLGHKSIISITIDNPWVYVEDNGIGIDKNIENLIFDPFVTSKPKGEGRGLGLFIVRQLMESLGCSVSLAPGRNSQGNYYRFSLNFRGIITEE